MPTGEVNAAMGGTIDATVFALSTLEGWRIAEVVDFVTHVPFMYHLPFAKVMDIDRWNALHPLAREALEQASEEAVIRYGNLRHRLDMEALAFAAAPPHNNVVITLDATEKARWMARLEPFRAAWVADANAAGINGTAVLAAVTALDAEIAASPP
jgi:TRAP-type C4-dicarboxylate transport system substrate-binding protein